MFKFSKVRTKTHYNPVFIQDDIEDGSRNQESPPKIGSRQSVHKESPVKYKYAESSDSESVRSFTENLFQDKPVKPVKKLERSRRHSITATSLASVKDVNCGSYENAPESPVSVYSKKSVDCIKEYTQKISKRSWTSEVDEIMHSNGDSRNSFHSKVSSGGSNKTFVSRENYDSLEDLSMEDWDIAQDLEASTIDRSWSSTSSTLDEEMLVEDPLDYVDAEEKFLEANPEYFELLAFNNVRRQQYPKLGLQRHVYLDYANFALSSRFQMEVHMRIMLQEGLGSTSSHLLEHVADAQGRLFQMFNTSRAEYSVVFTTGFTAGYRLVADAYPFQKGSPLLLCQDNHEAVHQLMDAAANAGGRAILAPLGEQDLCMHKSDIRPLMKRHLWHPPGSLFVYPAQSSVSGIRHSFHWIQKAQKSGWHVMLDVSTYLPTGTLDFSTDQPDFVVGSFQNMVGYPAGMGFLLVNRTSFCVNHVRNTNAITLTTKAAPTQGQDCHIVCEDESLSFLLFAGLNLGLQHLQKVGLDAVNKRVKALAVYLVNKLKMLRHKDPDDWHLVNVYSPMTSEDRGNIISFNVLDSTGEYIMPALVQRLAARQQITLGAGSFNNPGVANLLSPASKRVQSTRVFEHCTANFMCLRLSLGPMSNFQDAYRLVQFLSLFRNQDYVSLEAICYMEERQ